MNKYTIGEASKKVGLTSSTLRYYEGQHLINVQRDAKGDRYYTDEDLAWIDFLLHLKATGMKIADLKKYVSMRAEGDSTIEARYELLKRVKQESEAELRKRQESLEVLGKIVDWYEGKLNKTISAEESFAQYLQRIN